MSDNRTVSAPKKESTEHLLSISASDGEASGLVIDTSHGAGALRANGMLRLAAVKDLLLTASCVSSDGNPMPHELQHVAHAAWLLASDADDLLKAAEGLSER